MLASLVHGFGLEHFCPWLQEGLSLASDVFCVFGLKPCVLDYTPAPQIPMALQTGIHFVNIGVKGGSNLRLSTPTLATFANIVK